MPDYSKGKIYTIRNRDDVNKIYVGSTIQALSVRFGGHKKDCLREKCVNMKLYKEVNNNWNNWYIELYENFPCNSKEELLKREGEIIRLIGTLNTRIEGRDNKQYYIDNIDKFKEYRIENAEKIKEYRIENAEKIKEYNIENAEKIKEYRIENAEKIKEQIKQYRIENAEKIKEQVKKYHINNIDKFKEYNKEYRLINADKIKEYQKQYRNLKKDEKSQQDN